jgi:hypothetical protein
MKRLRAGAALITAAFIAAGAFAQTNEDLQKQLNELKSSMQGRIDQLKAENDALKGAPQEAGLETEVNRLSERMAAGTNLRSCASQIKLGGEFRYRGTYVSGTEFFLVTKGSEGTPGFGEDFDGFYGDMRTRLNFQYDFGCDVTAFAELQSHEAMGEEEEGPFAEWDGNDNDSVPGSVGMYQTWLEFRNVFSRPELSARIGRQEVVLGNQFQFGNADWYNGVVHDGLRVDWRSNCWSLTLLAMKLSSDDGDFNQLPSFFGSHDDDELYAAYFTLRSIKSMVLDLYWIYVNGHGGFAQNSGANAASGVFGGNEFLYPTANAYFHTFGARAGGCFNVACGLDWNVEAAFQSGTGHTGGVDVDVDAFTAEGELGLTFSKSNRFRIFVRGLFAEGPDTDSTGYLILYPNRHSNTGFRARYGLADFIPMSNVQSLQAGLHFDPACNWTLGATGLWAQTETDIGGSNSDYGTELDIWAEYRYSQQITLGAGVAFVFPDDAGQLVWGVTDDTVVIGYIQARLVF